MEQASHTPIDHDTMRYLWEHNKGIFEEQREIVEQMTNAFVQNVDERLEAGERVHEATKGLYLQRNFPFGRAYAMLPPTLFDALGAKTDNPVIPGTYEECVALAEGYMARRNNPASDMESGLEYEYITLTDDQVGNLGLRLWQAQNQGLYIDPDKWEQYKEASRGAVRSGEYMVDIMSARRAKSVANMMNPGSIYEKLVSAHATGRLETFSMMPTVFLHADGRYQGLSPVGQLFMPVGAYGEAFSDRVLQTTTYLANIASDTLRPVATEVAKGREVFIENSLVRGTDPTSNEARLSAMTAEGARSIMEAVALLMAEKVPGYDDPDKLLAAIVEQGIIEQLTKIMPMGLPGPLAFSGAYFPNILLNKGDNRLSLNPDVVRPIKQAKYEVAAIQLGKWVNYWSLPPETRAKTRSPESVALICPAAIPHGALEQMNLMFLRAFKTSAPRSDK